MKLVTFELTENTAAKGTATEQTYVGIMEGDTVRPLKNCHNMNDYIKNPTHYPADSITYSKGQFTLRAPIVRPLHDVICVGVNYSEHVGEVKGITTIQRDLSTDFNSIYFSKRVLQMTGHGEKIDGHFHLGEELDYEVELAVVIGKTIKNIEKHQVKDHVFGYSIFNDVSQRKLQKDHAQWFIGKSLDTFACMGPYIITADAVNTASLDIKSFVNGELRQNSNTQYMLKNVEALISELSHKLTLEAGDIIATGTPSGVGAGFTPPRYLKKGDNVSCFIEGIGTLENVVG